MPFDPIFAQHYKKIHLVGIGGIGMSGIARILLQSDFCISGSDIAANRETEILTQLGAHIAIGHHERNVNDADVVVISSAITPDNPEILAAHAQNIPVIPRAMMLAELMRLRSGIAICGAHGKTTTTSLIGTLMHRMFLDPTVVVGGVDHHLGTNAVKGQSPFIVTEADESDGSFLHLRPTIAVVTNIDADHLDFYQGGLEHIKNTFQKFLERLPFYGLAVMCVDDLHTKEMTQRINHCRIVTYGLTADAQIRAVNIESCGFKTQFDLVINDEFINRFCINMPGHYNVLNSLAAIAVLSELGIAPVALQDALSSFNGVRRRFMPVAMHERFLVIDDYAHHPTEIRSVLKAVRIAFAGRKVRVLFQPHRFSRTKDLMDEFATSFSDTDSLVITEIYAARETPIAGVTTHALIENIFSATQKNAIYAADLDEGAHTIAHLTEEHDIVLILGAGSITQAGPVIADLLSQKLPTYGS